MSLPLRERGLKFYSAAPLASPPSSLPLRERGLKSTMSFTGLVSVHVAPLAGAWIEIPIYHTLPVFLSSLPLRERGLKYPGAEEPRLGS